VVSLSPVKPPYTTIMMEGGIKNAQGAGGTDDAAGHLFLVVLAQQCRRGQKAHGHHRGADDARGGGKDGAHHDNGQAQTALDAAQHHVQGLKELVAHLERSSSWAMRINSGMATST
jgi:hypothetical protein